MSDPTNLGPRGARRRAALGAIALLAALPLFPALVFGNLPLAWAAPYALLLAGGALGALQARART